MTVVVAKVHNKREDSSHDSLELHWSHLTMAELGGLLILQGMWTLLPW